MFREKDIEENIENNKKSLIDLLSKENLNESGIENLLFDYENIVKEFFDASIKLDNHMVHLEDFKSQKIFDSKEPIDVKVTGPYETKEYRKLQCIINNNPLDRFKINKKENGRLYLKKETIIKNQNDSKTYEDSFKLVLDLDGVVKGMKNKLGNKEIILGEENKNVSYDDIATGPYFEDMDDDEIARKIYDKISNSKIICLGTLKNDTELMKKIKN